MIPPGASCATVAGAVTYTAQQAKDLLDYVEEHYPSAVPFFAFCLFAGIHPCLRTGEILRLKPDFAEQGCRAFCFGSSSRCVFSEVETTGGDAWIASR